MLVFIMIGKIVDIQARLAKLGQITLKELAELREKDIARR